MKEFIDLIEPILLEEKVLLYECLWRNELGMKILSVSIMFDDYTMDVETCEKISERISVLLDEHNMFDFDYYLEVASPGAEREVRNYDELYNLVGKYLHVQLDSSVVYEGFLLEVNNDVIILEVMDKTRRKRIEIERKSAKKIRLAVKL